MVKAISNWEEVELIDGSCCGLVYCFLMIFVLAGPEFDEGIF
jgi:hypothetical protein